ncbi:MAG: ribonuclease R [Gammaproteobacteria bacterium]|nr:ribonuclease R [Gammaproteobacteria bacterium]
MRQRPRETPPARDPETAAEPVVIPSRQDILAVLDKAGAPCTFKALATTMKVESKPEKYAFQRRLGAMVRDGQLLETRDRRFGIACQMELLPGRVIGHPDGYAFVRPDSGASDIYLAPREARRVLHGDRLLVRVAGQDERDRPYGTVVEVLDRANHEVVGRYFRDGGVGFVSPDNRHLNQDILIPPGKESTAVHGQIVIATIDQQPDARYQPLGHISTVLGDHMAPGMEIDIAIRSYELPTSWPDGLARELKAVPNEVPITECADREDFRDLPFVTIDGSDARDFDDAVYCRKVRGGYVLYVAIADVAHYVRAKTVLDRAARERGTSVYFPAWVIPMLPEQLSNGICSLNPAVDRLVVVCEMRYDVEGHCTKTRFANAVIHSRARLIYEDVAEWLANPNPNWEKESIEQQILNANELYLILRARREIRGALDIETVEPKFVFDAARKIERIESRQRTDAHRLIEEFMIAANVAAAEFLQRNKRPALFRIHAPPELDRIEPLRLFLNGLGMSLGGGERPHALDFSKVLKQAAGRPDRHLIETVLLRSLKLAVYSPDNVGHFGLALESYVHFTSPIRRYPDLIIHRALKDQIARIPAGDEDMHVLGEHCSMTERRADDATRDAIAWLKCEYMLDKVGEQFAGIVSGVTAFGLFVQLDGSFVEGLVHVTGLPEDYYHFDPAGHRMVGRSSGKEFRLGQRLEVIVARVNLDERKIDFSLPVAPPLKKTTGRKRRR